MLCFYQQKNERMDSFSGNIYLNLAVSELIMASCIRRRVTSSGYATVWATAPAKAPHPSLAGVNKTSPPESIYKVTQSLKNTQGIP